MTTLKKKELELFKKWATNDKNTFCQDGVINEKYYINADPKILFLLKETNSENSFSLSDFVAKGGRKQTWNEVHRWI